MLIVRHVRIAALVMSDRYTSTTDGTCMTRKVYVCCALKMLQMLLMMDE